MTAYPDWYTVPTHASECHTERDWYLHKWYGNDHDGPQGEFIPPGLQKDDDGYPFGMDQEKNQERFERWQKRNPYHNWCFIYMRKKVTNPTYIWGKPKRQPDGTLDYRFEMNEAMVLRYNPFFIKIGPLIAGWRSDKPHWPHPPESRWYELGPGGGALDIGAKDYRYIPYVMPQPSPPPMPPENPDDFGKRGT